MQVALQYAAEHLAELASTASRRRGRNRPARRTRTQAGRLLFLHLHPKPGRRILGAGRQARTAFSSGARRRLQSKTRSIAAAIDTPPCEDRAEDGHPGHRGGWRPPKMKTPETPRVPGASFFQISQSNRRCVSGPSFQSTFDSRRRSIFRPCPRTQPPTLIGCRTSPVRPSNRPSTCAADQPSSLPFELNLRLSPAVASSSSSFQPAFDLRRPPALRPRLPNSTSDSRRSSHLRLILTGRPLAFAADQPSGPAFKLNLRLSPAVASPARPSDQPSVCAAGRPSRLAFELNP
jgi:hypothetical protein